MDASSLIRNVFVAGCLCLSAAAAAASKDPYPSLHDRVEPAFQQRLEQAVSDLGLGWAADAGRLGLALVDITDPERPRVAAINGDRMLYAASLPKIAILLGAFEAVEHGEMRLDAPTAAELSDMIRVSSNQAATRLLNRVGKPKLAKILSSPRYRLYDPDVNGGLWVGKDYAKKGVWKRDPLHNLSHGATALQTARFYYLLETGRLVTPKRSRQMKALMANSGINHKFVLGLAGRPSAKIYRKSGSWRQWHADSALVEHADHTYIAVGLVEHPDGGKWLSSLIVAMDDIVVEDERATGLERLAQVGRVERVERRFRR